ncbi:sugar phosphate isomerase/epimerase family protein [Pollutibacter soli]|uniref:sugar phosphate isomerase/epimerase family protein n=1 Tax=Pollutibacter soli TaxID=3034157 RepID=UPI0030135CB8
MDRRAFIHTSGTAALGLAVFRGESFAPGAANVPMGIVVHSYGIRWQSKFPSAKYPGFADAVDMMNHCRQIGAAGVQVVVKGWSSDFAKKVRATRENLGLYLEGSIAIPASTSDVPRFEQELIAAKEAGAQVLRTVSSSGRRYEAYHNSAEVEDFKLRAIQSLQLTTPVLAKHKVRLAVENHKDWLADELVYALKKINSEWIGVTLDFGNSISLIEDPMDVVEKLAPYAFSTHVKDMGVDEYADGFLLSEVPMGKGILDLQRIYSVCLKHNPGITFNLEMITRDPLQVPCLKQEYWNVLSSRTGEDLANTLRMVRSRKYPESLPRTSQLSAEEKLALEENNILECLKYNKTIAA